MWKRIILICCFFVGLFSIILFLFQTYVPEISQIYKFSAAFVSVLAVFAGLNEAVELTEKIFKKDKENFRGSTNSYNINTNVNHRDDHRKNYVGIFIRSLFDTNVQIEKSEPSIGTEKTKYLFSAIIKSGNNVRIQFVNEELLKLEIPENDTSEIYSELENLHYIKNNDGIISVTRLGKIYLG